MNKQREKILQLNFKKIVISYIVVVIVAAIIGGVVLVTQFGGRIQEIKQDRSTFMEEYEGTRGNDDSRWGEKEHIREFEFDEDLNLTNPDKMIIGCTLVAFGLLLAVYWILVALWIIQRALKDNNNAMIWGLLALGLNIGAIIIYFIYMQLGTRCPQCGKAIKESSQYCSHCGKSLFRKCVECNAVVGTEDAFCSHCGIKQAEE